MKYVKIFLIKSKEYAHNQNWVDYVNLTHQVNQSFINNNDLSGLCEFYKQVLISSGLRAKYLNILFDFDYSNYKKLLSNSFDKAVADAKKDQSVKAI